MKFFKNFKFYEIFEMVLIFASPLLSKRRGTFDCPRNRYFSQITLTNRIYLYKIPRQWWKSWKNKELVKKIPLSSTNQKTAFWYKVELMIIARNICWLLGQIRPHISVFAPKFNFRYLRSGLKDYKGQSPSNGKLSDFSFYIDSQKSAHRKFKK